MIPRLVLAVLALTASAPAQDANRGKDLFERRCSGCHASDKDKEGPRLRGVFGRPSGSVRSFQYSDPLRKSRLTWDAETLEKWLTDPEKLVPETDMNFRVVQPEERAAIIAYLKQLR